MIVFTDTGVLLRFFEPSDPLYVDTRRAVTVMTSRGDQLVMSPQNLSEFWCVCTRPKYARNGLGLSIAETDRRVTRLESLFGFVEDLPTIYPIWRGLVVNHSVSGRQVYDAKLTATMMAHSIDAILTFNCPDFSRFPGITAIDPRTV